MPWGCQKKIAEQDHVDNDADYVLGEAEPAGIARESPTSAGEAVLENFRAMKHDFIEDGQRDHG